jgi:hypothetical protein
MATNRPKTAKANGAAATRLDKRAKIFADAVEANEQHMPEMAAFFKTCDQFGISDEEGYDLLAEYAIQYAATQHKGD